MPVKPPALPERATIAVVAISAPAQSRSEIEQAAAHFEGLGHELRLGPNHRRVHGYLAGTDAERAEDLQWALSEPGIDMVHFLQGGYGAARLYRLIDWERVGEPRIVCGFSDITPIHLALARRHDWVTFYGPNFLRFTRERGALTELTADWFARAFRPEPLGRLPEDPEDPYVLTVNGGVAEGPLRGGCLSLVASSLGTPWEIKTEGTILLLEDLDEEPYLVDGHINHLIQAGKLDQVAGVAFGPDVRLHQQTIPDGVDSSLSIEELLDELIGPLGIPAVAYMPFGHGKDMVTLPLGVRARLDADAKTLEVLEAGVR